LTIVKKQAVFFFLLLGLQSSAQNLIPNPSFDSIFKGKSGGAINGDLPYWNTANQASPDLWHDSIGFKPSNTFPNMVGRYDNQSPRTGPGMVGLQGYTRPINHTNPPKDNSSQFECLQARLIQPLVKDATYSFGMYVNIAANSLYTYKPLGATLTVDSIVEYYTPEDSSFYTIQFDTSR